jgi:cytochrome o ubiquinol oxidase subunit III
MSSAAQALQTPRDPNRLYRKGGSAGEEGGNQPPESEAGPAPKDIVVAYGFWIFLLSDIIMFSALFAAYAVLHDATAGGPAGLQLFDKTDVAIETVCLLLSSYACGLAMVAASTRSVLFTQIGLFVTGVLGFAFLALELAEFTRMLFHGAGPQRSAFLSAFFTLVGCHGLHVTAGLLWLGTMMAQIWAKGFAPAILRRLKCFSLFWHALDIIWVGLFTMVYLLGGLA